jgi:hypothetical protein
MDVQLTERLEKIRSQENSKLLNQSNVCFASAGLSLGCADVVCCGGSAHGTENYSLADCLHRHSRISLNHSF